MAGKKPWEKYAGATVGEAPAPTPEAPTPEAPDGRPVEKTVAEQVADRPSDTAPHERFRNATVGIAPDQDMDHAEDLAAETEQHLARVYYTPPAADTLGGWLTRAGRSTWLGTSDVITSKILGHQIRKQDPSITDAEMLAAIRKGFAEDQSMSADIVGSLVPGAAAVKGLQVAGKVVQSARAVRRVGATTVAGMAVNDAVKGEDAADIAANAAVRGAMALGAGTLMTAAGRTGVVKGSIQWLSKGTAFSRIASAAGGGAAVGATYEAVRESVDQAVGKSAGEHVNPEDIMTAGLQGAVVGALMGPVANEAMRGAAGVLGWAKQAFGGTEATTMAATKRIVRALSVKGETPDGTVTRLRQDIELFTTENGRPPALFEVIAPDKAAELADVARYYSGISPKMRALTDKQVVRAVDTFEAAAQGARPLKDTEVVKNFIRDQFDSVMSRHGDDMVNVGDEAMDALSRNRGFLETQAKGNVEARQLLGIVRAHDDLAALSSRAGRLASSKNLADEQAGIADMKRDLAEMIDEARQAAEVEPSAIERLKNLIQLESSLTNQFDKAVKAGWAEANSVNASRALQHAQTVLNQYAKDGAQMSLRSANAMRVNASRAANNPNDPNFQAMGQAVRDAIAPVGTKEVTAYGRVVKLWNTESTRAEAAGTGVEAVRGRISPENLAERIRTSRLPGKAAGSPTATRRGIEEGARIDLRNTARSGEAQAVSRAGDITGSKLTQQNVRQAIPGQGGRDVVRSAAQVTKTDAARRAVNSKMSPSELAEQVAGVKDDVMAAVIGNVGGAGFAGFVSRYFMKFMIPRKTALRLVDMLGDPDKVEDALSYVVKRGIPIGQLAGVMANAQIDSDDRKLNRSKNKRKK